MENELFESGNFILHSGEESYWKINVDVLSDEDLWTIANIASQKLPDFGIVESVPTGGNRLARIMQEYTQEDSRVLLIVDDVLTTGVSMEEQRGDRDAIGLVLFARRRAPSWVYSFWEFWR